MVKFPKSHTLTRTPEGMFVIPVNSELVQRRNRERQMTYARFRVLPGNQSACMCRHLFSFWNLVVRAWQCELCGRAVARYSGTACPHTAIYIHNSAAPTIEAYMQVGAFVADEPTVPPDDEPHAPTSIPVPGLMPAAHELINTLVYPEVASVGASGYVNGGYYISGNMLMQWRSSGSWRVAVNNIMDWNANAVRINDAIENAGLSTAQQPHRMEPLPQAGNRINIGSYPIVPDQGRETGRLYISVDGTALMRWTGTRLSYAVRDIERWNDNIDRRERNTLTIP